MFELRTCDWLRISVLGCALLAVIQTAAAQNFPSRPLTLVVPFAAGGPSDVAGRIIAQGLSETLGQQVVVENPAERRSPEYFAKFAAAEIDKWYGPIKVSGVSVD